jgi:hypothetical protein
MTNRITGAVIVLAQLLGVGLMVFGGLALAIWAMSKPVGAQEVRCQYERRTYPAWDSWTGQIVTRERYVRRCYRNHAYYLPEREPTRVYGYERRRDIEYAGGVDCRAPMRATGDDRVDQDRAEVSAQDRWAVEVETHLGSKYSDVRYAADMRTTCVRKVPNTATEKGQALFGVRHFLCSVSARPCSAPAVRVDEDTRAKRRSERVEDERAAPAPSPRRDR